jgi:hypothetical protein
MCVCVCVCVRERERGREIKKILKDEKKDVCVLSFWYPHETTKREHVKLFKKYLSNLLYPSLMNMIDHFIIFTYEFSPLSRTIVLCHVKIKCYQYVIANFYQWF